MSQQSESARRRADELGRPVVGGHLVQAPPPTDISTVDSDAGEKVRWWLLALLVGLGTWTAFIFAVMAILT